MIFEQAPQPKNIEKVIKKPAPDISKKNERAANQKEFSPEEIKKSKNTILDTLDIDSAENLDNFDGQLKESVKSLPKYKEIEAKLKNVDKKDLPHELFNLLKKDADKKEIDQKKPRDGVLIKSMKQGHLECAGRTLIASTILKEHNIDHTVVTAPGHSFVVIEQSLDTLAYFDANNNLFFTFPKEALTGYGGTQTSSECRLKNYIPRETDVVDGINTAFSHFVTTPAAEGVGRQYLDNVTAALSGNKEFETSGVTTDKELSKTTEHIQSELYGKNSVLDNFYSKIEGLLNIEELQTEDDKKIIGKTLQKNPDRNSFVEEFTRILKGQKGDRIPYIKNASDNQKKNYAGKLWDELQKRNLNETITGR